VVKADGLCNPGDGSVVCDTAEDAERAIDGFARRFGGALRLVIEERLRGPEISIFRAARWRQLPAVPDGDGLPACAGR